MKQFDTHKIKDKTWRRFKYSVGVAMLLGTATYISDRALRPVKESIVSEEMAID